MGLALLYLILGYATIYDIREYRVPNVYILFGLGTGLLYQFFSKGIYGLLWWAIGVIIPFVLLFVFYLFHVLGAGDIKLFLVVGGILGMKRIPQVIILAFVIGAVMSIIQLIRFRNLTYRLHYLANYIQTLSKEKKITPYFNPKEDDYKAVIPFTAAILLSIVVLHITGKLG